MIRVRLGGWPFVLPQRWNEVSYAKALKLYQTHSGQVRERLTILGHIPGAEFIALDPAVSLAAYELVTFIKEIPQTTTDRVKVMPVRDWSFAAFEFIRQAVIKHRGELPLAFARITEVLYKQEDGTTPKDKAENYVEIGAKALDDLDKYLDYWQERGLFDEYEPDPEERAAGVERVQAFGIYSVLEAVASKYGRLPEDIAKQPAHWVLTEWHYQAVKGEYLNELHRLKAAAP